MARSPRRITRRDIRKPDQFVAVTGEIFHFVKQKRKPFIGAAAAVVLALVGLWGWDAYAQRQNHLAAKDYVQGVNLYHAGKYADAVQRFDKAKEYTLSSYSAPALLYQANSYLALGDPAKAAASLAELLQQERKQSLLRQLGLLSLAYLHETAGNCKEAGPSFAEAEKIVAPFTDEAILGKARCGMETQDLKGALESYRQYLTSYPAGDRVGEVTIRVQELEAKVAASGGK
ncbi:MAG: tetratricopeptide repeat protein [Deltaproteobacteria bacterium]|nr:tetratricopeptide repeat protein [Deltaproteobacteria bacterium]MBI2991496.1 tetratricopeptide repeat protein [Deltaproteobacteria bacterium]MBI3062498.1 tetratricopeptide repeat protein [Deltaproteobacteria bacterium]